MKKIYLFLCVCIMCSFMGCYAQIFDDFSTSDFLSRTELKGDVDKFKVEEGLLKLNASEAGSAFLSLPCSFEVDTIEWQWTVNHNFASSNNNFSRIYLYADNDDLNACEGFFLQLGENGSSDAIELFYQEGNTLHSICRGTEGRIAAAFQLRIRVLNIRGKYWKIYVYENDDWKLDVEGESNITQFASSYTGLYAKFTTSNISKFSYDDFYCGPVIYDTVSPQLLSVAKGLHENQLCLNFSERLDTFLIDKLHFRLDNLEIESVSFLNQKTVVLEFEQNLQRRHNYSLSMCSIPDLSGNVLVDTMVNYVDYYPLRNDVVISEIMADPSPSVGLPECEYIELYNRSPFSIDLSQWTISVGNSEKKIPQCVIDTASYLLLVPSVCLDFFSKMDNVVALSSLSIPNEGQQLVLSDENGFVVHEVEFSVDWHSQALKSDGGWSLEMIDAENPCTGKLNWDSSIDEQGGTPGFTNSIARQNQDEISPELLHIVTVDSVTLNLFFSETIGFDTTELSSLFRLDHDLSVVSASLLQPKANSMQLKLSPPLRVGTIYTLQLVGNICDCVGLNVKPWSSAKFGLAQKPNPNDVIINEILTHTFDNTDADFIELYNRSYKIINLSDLQIAYEAANGKLSSTIASKDGYLLFPKSFAVLCKDKEMTRLQYYCPQSLNLLNCPTLPNFPNAEGTVLLMDNQFSEIDRFSYTESMHYSMLTDLAGVSLERIHYDTETQNSNNWKSASANVGFATPGYKNSQHSDEIAENLSPFSVSPEVFSPDGDGIDDYTELSCHFDDGGYRLTIHIFNSKGHLVKVIADNMPVGLEESFIWDGTTNDGISAPHGIYIARFSYWNEFGKRKSLNKFVGVTYRK